MAEQNQTKPKFRTSIGGQALIEGILMRGPEKQAIVVRSKEGLVEKVEELKLIRDRYPILGLPVLRGAVTFVDSMVRGVKALMYSADFFPEEEGEPSKLDLWLEKKLGSEKLQKLVVALAVVLSLGLTIGLFMILPTFLAGLLGRFIPNVVVHNLVESVIKLLIFFGYLLLCSKQKDIQRVFQYHGAEHKTIFCYEAGLPLTVENCRIQPRHHPRCGTSFLFVVVVVSILVSSVVFSFVDWRNVWVRIGLHLLLLVPVVGVTYEFNRYVGGHDNPADERAGKAGAVASKFHDQRAGRQYARGRHRARWSWSFPSRRARTSGKWRSSTTTSIWTLRRRLLRRRARRTRRRRRASWSAPRRAKRKMQLLRDGLLYASPEVERSAYSLCARASGGRAGGLSYRRVGVLRPWRWIVSPAVLIPRPDTEVLVTELVVHEALDFGADCRACSTCARAAAASALPWPSQVLDAAVCCSASGSEAALQDLPPEHPAATSSPRA